MDNLYIWGTDNIGVLLGMEIWLDIWREDDVALENDKLRDLVRVVDTERTWMKKLWPSIRSRQKRGLGVDEGFEVEVRFSAVKSASSRFALLGRRGNGTEGGKHGAKCNRLISRYGFIPHSRRSWCATAVTSCSNATWPQIATSYPWSWKSNDIE